MLILKTVFAVIILFSCLFPQNLKPQIDSVLSDYNKEDSPGAALMIIQNGKILYSKGYGLANIEEKIHVTTKTDFRLASVTKEFTATAIMKLVEEGKLNYNDNLFEIFPGFPEYGKDITVKNLLNHTSGLIAYEDLIPDSATVQVKDKDVLAMMMSVDSTYFEPGTEYRYSNTGYALLAMIVEKKSGKSFAEYLTENIFDPLEMKSSVAYEKGISEVPNRAYGYERTDSGWTRKDQSLTSAVLGDGGIYTSIEDMYKWDQNLYKSKIISQASVENSFKRNLLKNGDKIDYGYGWHLKTYNGDEIVYHGGSTVGFRNVIYRIPSKKFTIIILTNRDEGEPEKLAEQIVDFYFPKK